jgi:hypothetical protein
MSIGADHGVFMTAPELRRYRVDAKREILFCYKFCVQYGFPAGWDLFPCAMTIWRRYILL